MWPKMRVAAALLSVLSVSALGVRTAGAVPSKANGYGSTPGAHGTWSFFQWGGDGWSATFDLSTETPLKLRVTDVACKGDRFDIFDGGAFLGRTSAVPIDLECDDSTNVGNPNHAFHDPTYSHTGGWLNLAAGAHSLQFYAVQNPFGGGGAYYGLRG
jgi:hypothetical protein